MTEVQASMPTIPVERLVGNVVELLPPIDGLTKLICGSRITTGRADSTKITTQPNFEKDYPQGQDVFFQVCLSADNQGRFPQSLTTLNLGVGIDQQGNVSLYTQVESPEDNRLIWKSLKDIDPNGLDTRLIKRFYAGLGLDPEIVIDYPSLFAYFDKNIVKAQYQSWIHLQEVIDKKYPNSFISEMMGKFLDNVTQSSAASQIAFEKNRGFEDRGYKFARAHALFSNRVGVEDSFDFNGYCSAAGDDFPANPRIGELLGMRTMAEGIFSTSNTINLDVIENAKQAGIYSHSRSGVEWKGDLLDGYMHLGLLIDALIKKTRERGCAVIARVKGENGQPLVILGKVGGEGADTLSGFRIHVENGLASLQQVPVPDDFLKLVKNTSLFSLHPLSSDANIQEMRGDHSLGGRFFTNFSTFSSGQIDGLITLISPQISPNERDRHGLVKRIFEGARKKLIPLAKEMTRYYHSEDTRFDPRGEAIRQLFAYPYSKLQSGLSSLDEGEHIEDIYSQPLERISITRVLSSQDFSLNDDGEIHIKDIREDRVMLNMRGGSYRESIGSFHAPNQQDIELPGVNADLFDFAVAKAIIANRGKSGKQKNIVEVAIPKISINSESNTSGENRNYVVSGSLFIRIYWEDLQRYYTRNKAHVDVFIATLDS